jgi:hypothetical protein
MAATKKQITEGRLRAALDRLLAGKPEKVPTNGKLSIKRVNDEAGLSRSYIYKFPEIVDEAEKAIAEYIKEHGENYAQELVEVGEDENRIEKLKRQLATETRLKKEYKQQRDNIKTAADLIAQREATLAYRVFELEQEILQLTRHKVTSIR